MCALHFSDQVYRTVTSTSQHERCFDCKDSWDRLTSLRLRGSLTEVESNLTNSARGFGEATLLKAASVESGVHVDDVTVSSGDESSVADSALSSLRSSPDVERSGVRSLVFGSAFEAIDWIEHQQVSGGETQVLVTGSSHLVGCVLGILDPNLNSS